MSGEYGMGEQDLATTITSGRPITWTMGSIEDESYASLRKEFSSILDTLGL